jgi:hypothetical protein
MIYLKKGRKCKSGRKKLFILEGGKKKIIRILTILWLVSTVFLFLRMLLESLGFDPKSIFAMFIYIVSSIFLLPFFGIFPHFTNSIQPGKPVFDSPALTGIFCYTVLTLLAVAVTHLMTKILKTEKQVDEKIEKNNQINPLEISEKVK